MIPGKGNDVEQIWYRKWKLPIPCKECVEVKHCHNMIVYFDFQFKKLCVVLKHAVSFQSSERM